MNNHRLSRRQFLQHSQRGGASLAGSSIWLEADPITALPHSAAPSDRIRFGVIGVGMEGVHQDAVFGNHAAIACYMAIESYYRKSPVIFDPVTKSINA